MHKRHLPSKMPIEEVPHFRNLGSRGIKLWKVYGQCSNQSYWSTTTYEPLEPLQGSAFSKPKTKSILFWQVLLYMWHDYKRLSHDVAGGFIRLVQGITDFHTFISQLDDWSICEVWIRPYFVHHTTTSFGLFSVYFRHPSICLCSPRATTTFEHGITRWPRSYVWILTTYFFFCSNSKYPGGNHTSTRLCIASTASNPAILPT